MKPIDAIKPENYDLLINNYKNCPNNNNIKFEVGDIVRIPIYLTAFTKEITDKWTRNYLRYQK